MRKETQTCPQCSAPCTKSITINHRRTGQRTGGLAIRQDIVAIQ